MQQKASGQPIVNMLFEFEVHFDYNNGDPTFSVWQNGVKVTNGIVVESHAATLVFRLQGSNLPADSQVVYASHFQWLDQNSLPRDRPANIAFIRDGNDRVTLLDSNPNTQEGEINFYHFLISAIVSGTDSKGLPYARMYTSHDPVIINKKPPA